MNPKNINCMCTDDQVEVFSRSWNRVHNIIIKSKSIKNVCFYF